MRVIPEIGSSIWANVVRPGYIIETGGGERIDVQIISEEYDTITLSNGWGRRATVGYADQVRVLGFFNPDPAEDLVGRI
jgi:hypothetical protein